MELISKLEVDFFGRHGYGIEFLVPFVWNWNLDFSKKIIVDFNSGG